MRVVRFYVSCRFLILPVLVLRLVFSCSSGWQCSPPDLNCEGRVAVFPAGPQLRAPAGSVPRRSSTSTQPETQSQHTEAKTFTNTQAQSHTHNHKHTATNTTTNTVTNTPHTTTTYNHKHTITNTQAQTHFHTQPRTHNPMTHKQSQNPKTHDHGNMLLTMA